MCKTFCAAVSADSETNQVEKMEELDIALEIDYLLYLKDHGAMSSETDSFPDLKRHEIFHLLCGSPLFKLLASRPRIQCVAKNGIVFCGISAPVVGKALDQRSCRVHAQQGRLRLLLRSG